MERDRRTLALLKGILMLLTSLAALLGAYRLFLAFSYETFPIHHSGDGAIYTTVGRGILAGLIPYRDLFEIKPPGIFLISALSLRLTGTILLANWLGVAAQAGLLALIVLTSIRHYRRKPSFVLALGIIGSCALGTLLVLYSESIAGGFNTEPFGTIFAILYLTCVTTTDDSRRPKAWSIGLMSLCILAGTGLKEPFFILMIMGGLLLRPTWKSARWNILLPCSIAIVTGLIVMQMLGYLEPYLSIYVQEMVKNRLHMFDLPQWTSILLPHRIMINAWKFSPVFTLSMGMIWLGGLMIRVRAWEAKSVRRVVFLMILSAVGLVLTERWVFDMEVGIGNNPEGLYLPALILAFVWILVTWTIATWIEGQRADRTFGLSLLHLTAFFIVVKAIGSGGFLMQQYAFGITIYTALWYVLLHVADEHSDLPFTRHWMTAIVVGLLLGVITLHPTDFSAKLDFEKQMYAEDSRVAEEIDGIMAACNMDRYATYSSSVPYHLLHHLPTGPAFSRLMFVLPVGKKKIVPFLRDAFIERLLAAPILFTPMPLAPGEAFGTMADLPMPPDVVGHIKERFSLSSPGCASGRTISTERFVTLYRKAP